MAAKLAETDAAKLAARQVGGRVSLRPRYCMRLARRATVVLTKVSGQLEEKAKVATTFKSTFMDTVKQEIAKLEKEGAEAAKKKTANGGGSGRSNNR